MIHLGALVTGSDHAEHLREDSHARQADLLIHFYRKAESADARVLDDDTYRIVALDIDDQDVAAFPVLEPHAGKTVCLWFMPEGVAYATIADSDNELKELGIPVDAGGPPIALDETPQNEADYGVSVRAVRSMKVATALAKLASEGYADGHVAGHAVFNISEPLAEALPNVVSKEDVGGALMVSVRNGVPSAVVFPVDAVARVARENMRVALLAQGVGQLYEAYYRHNGRDSKVRVMAVDNTGEQAVILMNGKYKVVPVDRLYPVSPWLYHSPHAPEES
jgi:hypothetical protein